MIYPCPKPEPRHKRTQEELQQQFNSMKYKSEVKRVRKVFTESAEDFEVREEVRNRDGWICVDCKTDYSKWDRKSAVTALDVHHARGRKGALRTDKRWMACSCSVFSKNQCHAKVTNNPAEHNHIYIDYLNNLYKNKEGT